MIDLAWLTFGGGRFVMSPNCYHKGVMAFVSTLCAVCGMNCGMKYSITENGEPLCPRHVGAPRCHMCETVKGIIQGPTIPVCTTCCNYVIVDYAGALKVCEPVLAWLTSELGVHRLSEVQIEVGSMNTNARPPYNLGHAALIHSGNRGRAEIMLASHQHSSMLASTIAHEYGHVLLSFDPSDFTFHGNFNREPHIDEGSCEVVRALWLEYSNTQDAKFLRKLMDKNIDPVYGDGFRMMWKEYQKIGSLKRFLDHVVNDGVVALSPVPINRLTAQPPPKGSIQPVAPIDQHRPTIRVVPPSIGKPTKPVSPTTSAQRPTIRVVPPS